MINRNLILIAVLLFFAGCKKKAQPNPEEDIKDFSLKALTWKGWRLTLIDNNPSANPPGDKIYRPIRECDKDDILTFNPTTSVATFDYQTTRCDGVAGSSINYPYELDLTAKTFRMNQTNYNIIELNAKRLKYTQPQPFGQTIIYMFEHP